MTHKKFAVDQDSTVYDPTTQKKYKVTDPGSSLIMTEAVDTETQEPVVIDPNKMQMMKTLISSFPLTDITGKKISIGSLISVEDAIGNTETITVKSVASILPGIWRISGITQTGRMKSYRVGGSGVFNSEIWIPRIINKTADLNSQGELETEIEGTLEDVTPAANNIAYIVDILNQLLQSEYQSWQVYTAHAATLGSIARGTLEEEFLEHAEDEQQHIQLLEKLIYQLNPEYQVLVQPPATTVITDLTQLFQYIVELEQQGIKDYGNAINTIDNDGDPVSQTLQQILLDENHHLQDALLWLKNTNQISQLI